ncbi:hypothetical protein SAMN05428981_109181 [Bacillus sp. OV194]|nr:hypothetical protein SAMN05428981_109181 [Bacillus sp. OV194]
MCAECDRTMKILGITLSMFILLTCFSLTLDIYEGFDMKTAILNALSPFKVIELIEICVVILLIALFFAQSVFQLFTKFKSQRRS